MDVVCPERNQTPDRRIETETREKDPVRLDADKDFLCPICIQPLKDTFLTSCGHSFCYLCITTHLNNRKNCPCCGVYLTTSQLYPNIALNKILKKLSTCQMTNATSPTEQLRLVLQQGAEMSPKEIDSLLIILAQKKRKMEQEEAEVNTEVLLEFLCRLRRQKLEELNEIQGDLLSLKEDISRVENQRLELLKSKEKYLSKWRLSLDRPAALTNISNGGAIVPFVRNGQSGTTEPAQEQRKIFKRKIRNMSPSKNPSNVCLSRDNSLDSDLSSPAGLRAAKKKRVLSQFEQLQDCYLQKCRKYREKHTSEGNIKKEADENSEPMNRMFQGSQRTGLDDFRDILTGFTRYSRMQVVAELRHGGLFQSSNLVSSIEFDRDDELFATAGVSRRIKIFEFSTVVNELADVHCPVMEMPTRSKLSCLSWNKYIKGHIASSDYEGIVTVWDVNTRQSIMEYEEHEKRAWSVDFSRTDPTMLVSGSDDGKVKLWCTRQETSALNIEMKANICSVKYNPGSSNFIAVGSADHNIHYYDLRNSKLPLHVFSGHRKAVSYVKFISPNELASASTDSTLRIWDVQKKSLVRTLSGHRNEKNFVGLTVSSEYLACGSETNEVFVYHKDLPRPAARHKFTSSDMEDPEEDPSHFICAVCWKSESPTMLAANSQGTIKVLVLAP